MTNYFFSGKADVEAQERGVAEPQHARVGK
jgi:hypothetical protein